MYAVIHGHSAIVSGGIQVDGSQIGKLQENELRDQAEKIKEKKIRNIAVVGVYSPTDEHFRQEELARDVLADSLGSDANIVCSKESIRP